MSSPLFPDGDPTGVFRRVAGDHGAPEKYFINKNCVTFGNVQCRDVIFECSLSPNASVVVRKDWLNVPICWKICNENCDQFFVNDTLFKKQETRILLSGDTFRFGLDEADSLTYSFNLYSAANPFSPEEVQLYYELASRNFLKKLDAEAEILNCKCAKLFGYLEELKRGKGGKAKFKAIADCIGKPMAAFQLIISTLASSPTFFFMDNPAATFGSAPCCDFVIHSPQCCDREALVQLGKFGWELRNESTKNRFFVNDRFMKMGDSFIIESGERIRIGDTNDFSMTYEFKLYPDGDIPSPDRKGYVEHHLKLLQDKVAEINRRRVEHKLKMEQLIVQKIEIAKRQCEAAAAEKKKKVKQEPSDDSPAEKAKRQTEEAVAGKRKKVKQEPSCDLPGETANVNIKEEPAKAKVEVKIKYEPTEVEVKIKDEPTEVQVKIKEEPADDSA